MKRSAALLASVITAAALTGGICYSIFSSRISSAASFTENYMKESYKIERDFIVNIPVYRDYRTPAVENELTRYNLKEHAVQVVKHGGRPLRNIEDIQKGIKSGRLVSAETAEKRLYYFHNVRKEYRYLTPAALEGLKTITERFQKKLQAHKQGLPPVKVAVSSVIRTVNYQKEVFGRKFVSTHSFGGCFDIFFEDFFVDLPSSGSTGNAESTMEKSFHRRLGFLMGDALRRQFRTVLSETLLELQREGLIYVFLENDRRCCHITVLKK